MAPGGPWARPCEVPWGLTGLWPRPISGARATDLEAFPVINKNIESPKGAETWVLWLPEAGLVAESQTAGPLADDCGPSHGPGKQDPRKN